MRRLTSIAQGLQSLVSDKRLSERALLDSMLDLFIESGFESARYYEINPKGHPPKDDVLFLRASRYADDFVPLGPIEIPYHASTIASSPAIQDIALGDSRGSPTRAAQWIQRLRLEDHRWVDILLRDQDSQPIALIALALNIEAAEFNEEELFAFSIIKLLLEHHLATQRLAQIGPHREIARQFINRNRTGEVPLSELATVCARLALSASGAQACAIFKYEWADRRLVKMTEEANLTQGRKLTNFDEAYFVGQNVTGAAWDTPRYRYIDNLGALAESEPDRVSGDCVAKYRASFGPPHSLLYRRVGSRFTRLHIRLINRADDPTLPFNKVQRDTFESVCHELSELVDEYSNQLVIRQLGLLAALGLRAFSDAPSIIQAALTSFSELGYDKATLLFKPKGASAYEVLGSAAGSFADALRRDPLVIDDSPEFERLTARSGLAAVGALANGASSDQLHRLIAEQDCAGAIAITSLHEGAKVVALRLVEDAASQVRGGTQLLRFPSEAESLTAMASIVSATIEASRSHVSAEFAEGLVAHFGHEVGTPFARLQNISVAGLNQAIKILRVNPEEAEAVRLIEKRKADINRASNYISQQMKAAVALANRSYGSIDVNFGPFGWKGIIDSAWDEAIAWKESDDGQSSARRIVLLRNQAIMSMRSIGDSNLIHNVLVNLLKNAIKYSLPRQRGEPMMVRIIGQTQDAWDIVQVENWGVGIPPDKKELIFDKFFRVDRIDRVRAIRGMGLGLYISRLYIDAHRGRISCRSSDPTLDDTARQELLEGYDTVFELRIPRTQMRGVQRIRLT